MAKSVGLDIHERGVRAGQARVKAQNGMLLKSLTIPFLAGPPSQVSLRLSTDLATVHQPVAVTGELVAVGIDLGAEEM